MSLYDVTILDQKHNLTVVIRNVDADTKAIALAKARTLLEYEGVPRHLAKRKKVEEVRQCSAKGA